MLTKLFENNHKQLKNVARRMCGNKWGDLVSETYLRVATFKTLPDKDEEFIKVFVENMKYQMLGRRSGFNKLNNFKDLYYIDYKHDKLKEGDDLEIEFVDDWSEEDVYLKCDKVNEATKDLIKELTHLTKEKVERYVNLQEFKAQLPGWDKEIFELHFEHGMSSRDIASHLKMLGYETNYQRMNGLINEVKYKIKEWKQLTL